MIPLKGPQGTMSTYQQRENTQNIHISACAVDEGKKTTWPLRIGSVGPFPALKSAWGDHRLEGQPQV